MRGSLICIAEIQRPYHGANHGIRERHMSGQYLLSLEPTVITSDHCLINSFPGGKKQ